MHRSKQKHITYRYMLCRSMRLTCVNSCQVCLINVRQAKSPCSRLVNCIKRVLNFKSWCKGPLWQKCSLGSYKQFKIGTQPPPQNPRWPPAAILDCKLCSLFHVYMSQNHVWYMVFWYFLAPEIKFDIRFALGMIFRCKTRLIHRFIWNLIEI